MLEHGGKVRQAARRYGIAPAAWLDLSTGINPNGWPVPPLPARIWVRLPEEDDELGPTARAYYGTGHILPAAGSQTAIQALPRLRAPCSVGVLAPGYAEHARAWQDAGHRVVPIAANAVEQGFSSLDVLIVINPNNPTGARFDPADLLRWHAQLAKRGGWLVVDEAFIDATPERSLARYCSRPGLIVLRSLGKFFGLAGARVGFVLADTAVRRQLHVRLGPWTVASPSRWIAHRALTDTAWQSATRPALNRSSIRLANLLTQHGLAPAGGCALFQWVRTRAAAVIHDALARSGILVRSFRDPASVRFGLPANEPEWQRLAQALARISETQIARHQP